ncbi:sodium-dependent transporter bedraggled isoform X2 [Parasteatoda tepidariorum]|uniref:sodium-dependent transporter bedraggled isoform X2 n=1 Tax=Parasteatoda tepidariorum TaxID=114398 RepID=UPI001C72984A|nr:sodium-dependent transporter bedraggled isoform X4 [Parasteatoda tepidariorum]
MWGWDVSYVWPLLEGVVTQPSRSLDSWQLVMGNPHEAAQRVTESGESSTRTESSRAPPVPPRVEPPPYESVANDPSISSPIVNSVINTHRNSSVSTSDVHRNARSSRTPRTRNSVTNNNVTSQRLRPQKWPHKASSMFACLCCVISVSNVSRFSMLVNVYKGCFIFQFLLLSILIGIPILYMQMSLGQYLGAGMLDMWYISPAFKGLGFAMMYLYIMLGIYNAVPLSWLFIYFKDSFITLKDSYKWGKCHLSFGRNSCLRALNTSSADFYGWSVSSYFHGRVLGRKAGEYQIGELKFEVAFNLCLVWIIIFICLSRGSKTFGKVVYVFGLLPIALLLMVTLRMGQQWGDGITDLLSLRWRGVLLDPSAWWLAAREAFITWGLFGTVALHICSHNKATTNVTKQLIAVVVTAIVVLISASFLFACAGNVLLKRNLSLAFSSYGRPYGTDQLVNVISRNPIRRSKILPFFTFMWNVVLPLSFLLLTISFLRTSSLDPTSTMGELMENYRYWQPWAKTLNLCLQVFPLILIITVCIYQTYKVFTSKREQTFLEKLKLLCCPVVPLPPVSSRSSIDSSSFSQGSTNSAFLDDPPPKYTPPPSYSTATSRMIAKQLEKQREEELNNTCAVDFENVDLNLGSADNDSNATINSTELIFAHHSHEIQRSTTRR